MSRSYLQIAQLHVNCGNGLLYVYLAGGTTLATLYDPVSGDAIANPVSIDSNGYVQAFSVDVDTLYDVVAVDYLGSSRFSRENVQVIGGSAGVPGPQGPTGATGATGATGPAGSNGSDGADGANGADGADGANGVSLVAIAVDGTSSTGRIIYQLSSSGEWLVAGDILPGGFGQVQLSESDTLGYLPGKVAGTDGEVVISNSGSQLVFSLDPALIARVDTLKTDVDALGVRVSALEAVAPAREVLYGGTLGATSVVVTHSLGTSNVAVSCYNTIDASLIFLNVVVTDTQVAIAGLNPLVADNQIKVVLVR